MVIFTCQAGDRYASEVAEESEGGREKTSLVKLIVFMTSVTSSVLYLA